MSIIHSANWIKAASDCGTAAPVFKKEFTVSENVKSATLQISSLGVYEAKLNGKRVGDFILAPGWTNYQKRVQYQTYDITELLSKNNVLTVGVGNGWFLGRISKNIKEKPDTPLLICAVEIEYANNSKETFVSDASFLSSPSPTLFNDIYDGETYDAREFEYAWENAVVADYSKDVLIEQEGEIVREAETIKPVEYIVTPSGEHVIDFGQNMTGYIQFTVEGASGHEVVISHAEILDKHGNFYTENLRSAKEQIRYICNGKKETFKPSYTFYGFRYIKLENWPADIDLNSFTAIVVHSDMKRTGHFECSNKLINQLFKNTLWGQKSNFLDVPTDCPQRDERLGWTGDAQVFIKTASYNYNVEKFFKKWLHDLASEQLDNGDVPYVVPNTLYRYSSAAWGDAAVICPWQIYLTYNNKDILRDQFESMKKWVERIRNDGDTEFLWNTGNHFGDWLSKDAVPNETNFYGGTNITYIASAFYAYSTSLLIKAGKVLGKDMTEYENLYKNIVKEFKKAFISEDGSVIINTQTANILALKFDLCDNKAIVAKHLAELIQKNGNKLSTGFVGTPYLLHVLSDNGYSSLAYTLLLSDANPSWLYQIKRGATTIWEHWNGINENGDTLNPRMNSYNHYAYGSVVDWLYGVMAGINTDENNPGFKHIIFKPVTDERIDFVRASIDTRYGVVASEWKRSDSGDIEYIFNVPVGCSATVILGNDQYEVGSGEHRYTK